MFPRAATFQRRSGQPRYSYTLNDPVNGVDPVGLDTCFFGAFDYRDPETGRVTTVLTGDYYCLPGTGSAGREIEKPEPGPGKDQTRTLGPTGAAFLTARAKLGKKECGDLIGGGNADDGLTGSERATRTLNRTDIEGMDLGGPTAEGNPDLYTKRYTAAAAGEFTIFYNTNQNGFLNPSGDLIAYLNGDPTKPVVINLLSDFNVDAAAILGRNATALEYQAFLLLHELAHILNRPDVDSAQFAQSIISNCLK